MSQNDENEKDESTYLHIILIDFKKCTYWQNY